MKRPLQVLILVLLSIMLFSCDEGGYAVKDNKIGNDSYNNKKITNSGDNNKIDVNSVESDIETEDKIDTNLDTTTTKDNAKSTTPDMKDNDLNINVEENKIEDKKDEANNSKENGIYKKLTEEEKKDMYFYVGFYNIDGGVLLRDNVKYGDTPKYTGPTPTYSDNKYDYTFIGWSKVKNGELVSFSPIDSTTFYYAKYDKVEKTPDPVEEAGPAPCTSTDNLWYIVKFEDETREFHNTDFEGNDINFEYTTHVLEYKKYKYTEYGYDLESSSDVVESTDPIGPYTVGHYYHNNGSYECPNPSSHKIK